jgi:outer membrane receptor for ferric coprogen and ferric-rhodotorulic acid
MRRSLAAPNQYLTSPMAKGKHATDYEDAVLAILAWEFSATDHRVTETKIRRKLSAKKIGKYDQVRVELLRRLKDLIQSEVGNAHKSKYYSKSGEEFADMKDFATGQNDERFLSFLSRRTEAINPRVHQICNLSLLPQVE